MQKVRKWEDADEFPTTAKMPKKNAQRDNQKMRDLKREEERRRKARYC